MQCGHCGTEVKEGFNTCAACGAVYEARANGCITLIAIIALLVTGIGLIIAFASSSVVFGIFVILIGAGLFWGVAKLGARTPKLWWRRQ